MISIRKVGFLLGFILLLVWVGVLFNMINSPEEKSPITEFFKTINTSVQFVSVFNCLGCIIWLYLLSKVKYENRNVFMLLSVIWFCLNLCIIIFFGLYELSSVETHARLQNYRYSVVLLVAVIHAFLLVVSILIFKSLADNLQPTSLYTPDVVYPPQPPIPRSRIPYPSAPPSNDPQIRNPYRSTTYKPQVNNPYQPKMNVNKFRQHRNHPSIAGDVGTEEFYYGNPVLDVNSRRWINDFIADSNSVPNDPHTNSHSHSSHHDTHTSSHDTHTSPYNTTKKSMDTKTAKDSGTGGGDMGGTIYTFD